MRRIVLTNQVVLGTVNAPKQAFANGIQHLQDWLHLNWELSINRWFAAHEWAATILDYYYATLHFLVTPAVLAWLFLRRPHIYRFPALSLRPGQSAFVFTGPGRNDLSVHGDFVLFAGRRSAVWNNTGDVAYLRDARGRIIDSRSVGHPARHPNGH